MSRGLTSICLDDLLDHFGKLQSGLMSKEEFARLQDILRQDDQAIQIYVEYVAQSVAIRQPTILEEEEYDEPVVRRKRPQDPVAPDTFAWVTPRRAGFVTCVLASLVVLSCCQFVEWLLDVRSKPNLVAFPLRHIEADTTEERLLRSGIHPNDMIHMEQGFAQFQMSSGVTVNVEAPAELKFVNENEVELISGKVDADVPKAAIGFRLKTPSGEIVDLGTRFCVEVNENGVTRCGVLNGLVETSALGSDTSKSDTEPLRLMEGTAVSVASGQFQAVDHRSFVEEFAPMDNALRGVLSVSSELKFLRRVPQQVGKDLGPILFFEKEGYQTTGQEIVNFSQTGSIQPDEYMPPIEQLPSGLIVSSLLFYARAPEGATVNQQGSVEIRFTYPIVGIITSPKELKKTQTYFGSSQTEYLFFGPNDRAGLEPNDQIWISEDRRTLTLQYSTLIDSCRILLKTDT